VIGIRNKQLNWDSIYIQSASRSSLNPDSHHFSCTPVNTNTRY